MGMPNFDTLVKSVETGDVSSATSVATAETMFGESKPRNSSRDSGESSKSPVVIPQGLDADWWDMVVIRRGKSEDHRFDSDPVDEDDN